jgi:hypothetical protein
VAKKSVLGGVPDDEQMQSARRKQRRLIEEADRAHMRIFGITPRRSWRVSCGRNTAESRCRRSWFGTREKGHGTESQTANPRK